MAEAMTVAWEVIVAGDDVAAWAYDNYLDAAKRVHYELRNKAGAVMIERVEYTAKEAEGLQATDMDWAQVLKCWSDHHNGKLVREEVQ